MEQKLSPAATAALLVLLVVSLLLALPLALVPIITAQITSLLGILPNLAERAGNWLGDAQPHVVEQLRAMDLADLAKRASGAIHADNATSAAAVMLGFFGRGAAAISGFFTFLLITPLAAFYFFARPQHHCRRAGRLAAAPHA